MRNMSFPVLVALGALLFSLGCSCSSYDEDRPPSATEAPICCGGGCCLIDSVCFRDGEANPDNADEICDVSCSQFEFTPMSGCAAGDPDMGPIAGDPDDGPIASDPDAGMGGGGDSGGCNVTAVGSRGSLASVFAMLGLALWGVRRRR